MQDYIYIRNDYQCLAAIVAGQIYHVTKDPLLKETYHSIVLNGKLIYFKDLVANRQLVNDPIGMAVVNSYVELMKDMEAENSNPPDYDVSLDYLFYLLGQTELLDGRELTETLSIAGNHLVELLERGDCDLSKFMQIDLDRKYFIPPKYIQDGYAHLSPGNVEDIVKLSNLASC
jgi:hypothetical protein